MTRKHPRPEEPTPLAEAIASKLSWVSTSDRPPATACRCDVNRRPRPLARPAHHRTREGMRNDLRSMCRALAAGALPWPLYLWSRGPGSGKTSAALVMLDHYGPCEVSDYPPDVEDLMYGFADFAALPGIFRAAEQRRVYVSPARTIQTMWPADIWGHIRRAKLLVLDDLRRPSDREMRLGDDHYGVLKRVLDERVGKPLIVTSNIDPWEPMGGGQSELVRAFDDRIADRLVCGTVFELGGASRRGE